MAVRCFHLKNAALELEASQWPSGSETKDKTGTFLGHVSTAQMLGWVLCSILHAGDAGRRLEA